MSSNPARPSVRSLLLAIVFQLGICVLLLSEIANATRGYGTLIALVGQLTGVLTAGAALLSLIVKPRPTAE